MRFVQLIEYHTEQADEADRIMDEWAAATNGKRTATRIMVTADRDDPGGYVEIVEFPSYEEAMRNSELPETNEIARKMRRICDGEPRFHNLDVRREEAL
ncbi:hypothetical protein DFQ14_112133 [Halopolyspora algeriensis]|uniref:Antibiotic biosynthesis monooxygenase n=1 Tax=Halopolyspora algeriensis TaxID=1500506 RepID=A0A368VGN5_9ACTN|nr:hypothetical protein [Halopolyspora algeriensis]RCW40251.1 hypothetical protein DFQ14_112133 [Halopolyspora algeriensis]TQM46268.1 hypothetical protein FHU43_3938 [Halopolyspora algeriensis]